MIELSLVLLVVFGAFVCAAGLARWNAALALGGVEQGRILSAIGRTSDGFFWRTLQKALPSALVLALGFVALRPLLGLTAALLGSTPLSSTQIASSIAPGLHLADVIWGAGFVLAGLATCALLAFLVVHSTLRVASRLLEATRDGLEHGLLVLLRGSGITALVTDGLATLLVVAALVLHSGQFIQLAGAPVATLKAAALALPALAVGALLSAWAFHSAGAVFGAGSKLARRAVRTLHRELGEEHDPSLIANLAATHLGAMVSRTLNAFLCGLLGQIVAVLLCTTALLDRPGVTIAPLALLALPVLARVIGLIAAAVGILATRVEAAQDLGGAVLRGVIATLLVSVGGLGGACYWLLGVHWLSGFVPGAIGCVMGSVLGLILVQHAQRRSDALSAQQLGQDTSPLSKVAVALEAVMITLLLTALGVLAAYAAGAVSILPNGGLFALVMMLSGMGSISPFMLTLNVAEPLADNVQSIAELRFAQLPSEGQRCAQQLRRALFAPACSAQGFLVLLGAVTTLLLGLCTVQSLAPAGTDFASTALGTPIVLWLGVMGSVLVLGSCALTLHCVASTTRSTTRDMLGQLMAKTDQGFTPNYKSTVDAGVEAALARSHGILLVAVLIPAAIAICIRLTAGVGSPLVTQGLLTFSIFATVTALTSGLVLQALCATHHDPIYRQRGVQDGFGSHEDEPGREQDAHLLAMTQTGQALRSFSPAFAELGGDCVAPTLQLQAASIAVICFLLSPFLT